MYWSGRKKINKTIDILSIECSFTFCRKALAGLIQERDREKTGLIKVNALGSGEDNRLF